MSSEKDVKKADSEEPVVPATADDPSLLDEEQPVASEEELSAAEEKVSAESAESGDSGSKPEPEPEEESEADDEEEGDGEGGQMGLLDHLNELRLRLTRSFIAIGVGMVACYGFADKMFDLLMQPMVEVFQARAAAKPTLPPDFYENFRQMLVQMMGERGFTHTEQIDQFVNALQHTLLQVVQEGHFQYTYPAEAFFSHIMISIVAGIFLVSPYVFMQIWGFIAPGLYAHERKWMVPMALISALFFTGGALFGYFQVFPYAFDFFAGFSTEGIQFTPKLNEYLSFCLKLLFAFGIVFELPLFIFFLARMGVVSSKWLRKQRKYAILAGFVVAAILTPPDPFTQCLMAIPLIILYEVGIWVAYFFGKKEDRRLKKQAEKEAAKQAEMDRAAEEAEAAKAAEASETETSDTAEEAEKA